MLEECAKATAVPRVTCRAMIKCIAAAARAAEPVQDAEWNQIALRHLQSIAASLHSYNSPALSLSAGTGKCCACSDKLAVAAKSCKRALSPPLYSPDMSTWT